MTLTLARLVLPIWLAGSSVAAQSTVPDPAAQSARELLAMTFGANLSEQMMNQFLEAVVESGRPGLQQALNRAPTDADMAAYRGALQRAFASVFTTAVWAEALAPIVATSFSVDEMNELIAFYRTPLGQKLLSFHQQGFQQGVAAGEELMQRTKVELTQALERELRVAFPDLVKPGR
jgi:hypothetical protein